MMMLANLLALALVAGEPAVPTSPFPALPKVSRPGTGVNPEADVVWHMGLAEALRIGLENSEVVGVVPLESGGDLIATQEVAGLNGGSVARDPKQPQVIIKRLNRDASVWNFKAAILAHLRSIEQQYWALSQCQVALFAREDAVRQCEEILKRERAKLATGKATPADVAEAEQQLENFKLNLASMTSDVITTERQLRNILGLPASDGRRIVPATDPSRAKVDPEWETCLALTMVAQPDIAQQRQLNADARRAATARSTDPGATPEDKDAAWASLDRQRGFFQQVVHQTTHSLARFFLEVDANYKQFQTAQRLRKAAEDRLAAQRAFYEEGRVAIDRLLDAVGQHANAVAQESQYLCAYNTSIAAFEEAKGTLLGYDGVMIVEPDNRPAARTPVAATPAKTDNVTRAKFDPTPAPAPVPTAPTTYKVKARVGGATMLEIEVEVNKPTPTQPPSR